MSILLLIMMELTSTKLSLPLKKKNIIKLGKIYEITVFQTLDKR